MSWKILPFEYRVNSDGKHEILNRLRQWWVSDENDKHIPLKWVGFVDCGLNALHFLSNYHTELPNTTLPRDPCKVFIVFYAIVQTRIHVLGGIPRPNIKESVIIKDLITTCSYNVDNLIPYQGSSSKDYWFYIPLAHTLRSSLSVSMDTVKYRMDLMFKWWEHRKNDTFAGQRGDGWKILDELHQSPSFSDFNLATDDGRNQELGSYWTLAWVCAHDPRLWDRWEYWEQSLLEFRIGWYFQRECHFILFIQQNNLLEQLDIIGVDDPGDRERELYTRRCQTMGFGSDEDSDGLWPTVWLAVPVKQVGRKIMENPLYDIDNGRVIITYRDFADWIWSLMEMTAYKFLRQIYVAKNKIKTPHTNIPYLLSRTLTEAQLILDRENGIESRHRFEKRARLFNIAPLSSAGGGSIFDTGNATALLEMAKRLMPPCMARHVWRALVHGRHPKNEGRLMLSMFLLDAEYTIEETEQVIYLLYEADRDFVTQHYHHLGGWNKEAFKHEYGGHVSLTQKSMREGRTGAYGCAKLTTNGGCPFADKVSIETRSFLGWAEVEDVEDIMRFKHPQERCCSYFKERHPDVNPLVIKHPNQFFRQKNGNERNTTTKKIKTGQ